MSASSPSSLDVRAVNGIKFAAVGCVHGQLALVYATIRNYERTTGEIIDCVICAGDFQAVRDTGDLSQLSAPNKYKHGYFDHNTPTAFFRHLYFNDDTSAVDYPLTLYIGGNHEASNYHLSVRHGGFVAPNIYYLGAANVIRVCKGSASVRICGVSGIYKANDYRCGNGERVPLDDSTMRSVYHIREYDVYRIRQLKPQAMDIVVSHDWPQRIVDYGDKNRLLRAKAHLRADVDSGRLGSPPLTMINAHCQPRYWLSAHLHVKFEALVTHADTARQTHFVALDKALNKRHFIQYINVTGTQRQTNTAQAAVRLEYDMEWLCIVAATASLIEPTMRYWPSSSAKPINISDTDIEQMTERVRRHRRQAPTLVATTSSEASATPPSSLSSYEAIKPNVHAKANDADAMVIPNTFTRTLSQTTSRQWRSLSYEINPQTVDYCQMIQIHDFMAVKPTSTETPVTTFSNGTVSTTDTSNPDEIQVDLE